MGPSVKTAAHSVRIFHQFCKIWELRIIPARIEMRRAVGIGIFRHRKGVGNQMIDALNEQMIQQMLHVAHAEAPAVGPE